ncbi:pyridoxamine 5'-phosphate oxidase family protein [Endozoicomonas sp. G2_2]|uniref:pyridoxamine 5'-phosphate oxidase family protein n=1 Tax=Endozoicomonas sp. G2_2 TaxID=2821092 RepID=UPI001ADC270C|nr:pyridoxamine 5'-phosphate oxidase family protein [Endozoicomonas sp. G2_2]MBO9470638.1 pyridoxamine 5'-phosphate oxidase family protein [Endozoicomonas sp. G2_2]
MSRLYRAPHRALQDRFRTRALADRIETVAAATVIEDESRAFIESRDLFFLSTIDPDGRPTVSHKGGAPGFVRVLDDRTLAFPNYDGNGMYLSMGNARLNPQVGLLFIDFERPHRLRVQGRASVSADDPLIHEWPGADLLVRVAVEDLWQNCPRYIHRYRRVAASPYVPVAGAEAPLAGWKRIDGMQDVLSDADQRRAEDEGVISEQAWTDQIRRGDPRA